MYIGKALERVLDPYPPLHPSMIAFDLCGILVVCAQVGSEGSRASRDLLGP
jgi:hypothetical protein